MNPSGYCAGSDPWEVGAMSGQVRLDAVKRIGSPDDPSGFADRGR